MGFKHQQHDATAVLEFWCCLRNGPFQEIDAKYCIPYLSWFSFISDHSSFYFVICLKKHVELPGRNLVQLRDRRAVGDNWREDFIQDCWSLRIGIVTSLILRWYSTDSKSMQVSWCVFFCCSYFTTFPYLDACYVYLIIIFIDCICFPWTGESIGKARRCSKGSADCERHQGNLVPPVFAVKPFKKLMDLYCLLAYCNCCQEQIDAFQPYLPIAASLPSFSNVETFQCIIAHSWD